MINDNMRDWRLETFGHHIPRRSLDLIDRIHAQYEAYKAHDPQNMVAYLNEVVRDLRVRTIPREDGRPYMTRYDIHGWMPEDGEDMKYPLSIYLHRFHAPDYDEAPHSHPWEWARSFVLTGGYVERRLDKKTEWEVRHETFQAGDINRIESDTFHVVERLLGETWTLFSTGPKTGSWGFQVPGRGYVPWRDRLRERGLKPEY